MTDRDLFEGMGCIDDQLIDEALRYRPSRRRSVLRWSALAACAGLVILAGVFALHRWELPKEDPDAGPAVMMSEPGGHGAEDLTAGLYDLRYDVRHQEDEEFPLTLVKLGDGAAYTDLTCEADGFQLVSRESTGTGERFLLRMSPGHPKMRAAVFTIHLKNGSEEGETLVLYGISTKSGVYVSQSLKSVWSSYYETCYTEGEYTDEEYQRIEDAIRTAPQTDLEDPAQSLNGETEAPEGVFRCTDGRIVGRYEGVGASEYIEVYVNDMGAGAGMGAVEINYPVEQAGDYSVKVYVDGSLAVTQTVTVP